MPKTTPFYPRLAELNETKLWHHWAGYLTALTYQYSAVSEYYATRDGVALFDTSPLFKYRIAGADATRFLSRVLARDVRRCEVGQAHYTAWCNEAGFVLEDGVVLHVAPQVYLLTSARPNFRYFSNLVGEAAVTIEDVSATYGLLAVQGPKSLSVLRQLTADVAGLGYFGVVETAVSGCNVILSRTGFTGARGYELWVKAEDALTVFDALMRVGDDENIIPMGETALSMARIEAGLLLIDVDFSSARYAWVDAQRETPLELGWGWMFRGLAQDDRQFIGRVAIEAAITNQTARWKTVGIEVDYYDYERVHRDIGIMPPKEGLLAEETHSIYKPNGDYAGYATSVMYSPLLKKHIGIAKLPPSLTSIGTEVRLEIVPIRQPVTVLARVVAMPFYSPPNKKA